MAKACPFCGTDDQEAMLATMCRDCAKKLGRTMGQIVNEKKRAIRPCKLPRESQQKLSD